MLNEEGNEAGVDIQGEYIVEEHKLENLPNHK